jgi:hypothetical protein
MSKPADRGGETEKAIFPTFFMAGFECSSFVWKDGQRKDYTVVTGHDRHFRADYECLMDLGIGVVRESVRWPIVDKGHGRYDWSSLDPLSAAMNDCRITAIWDLCHYGLPDDCDPFSEDCRSCFVEYCSAVAEHIISRTDPPRGRLLAARLIGILPVDDPDGEAVGEVASYAGLRSVKLANGRVLLVTDICAIHDYTPTSDELRKRYRQTLTAGQLPSTAWYRSKPLFVLGALHRG